MAARREDAARAGQSSSDLPPGASYTENNAAEPAPKKKRHRAGRKRNKNRRKSFAAPSETTEDAGDTGDRPTLLDMQRHTTQPHFYRLQTGNRSNTSLESEALLDHRDHEPIRARRSSLHQSGFSRPSIPFVRHRTSQTTPQTPGHQRSRLSHAPERAISEDEEDMGVSDRTPLLGTSQRNRSKPELSRNNSGHYGTQSAPRRRRSSKNSNASSRRRLDIGSRGFPAHSTDDEYDVNNPPSMPTSPKLGTLDDIMISDLSASNQDRGRDAIITIDGGSGGDRRFSSSSPEGLRRRPTAADIAEMDVCFPIDAGLSEIGEEEEEDRRSEHGSRSRRRRTRQWPDLEILEEWSRSEKEERTQQEHIRAKKIKEPAMVDGRLRRATKTIWHREEEEAPFRFTYFNETLDATIHAQTISDLLQDGTTFRDLFIPDPIPIVSSDSEEDGEEDGLGREESINLQVQAQTTAQSEANDSRSQSANKGTTGSNTPSGPGSQTATPRPHRRPREQRVGPRPTFWLDVLNPTEMEMKVLSKAFEIHQLTSEDIMMEEQREKVELFSNYYFVNYRSFEQDDNSEDYMEPVNIYVVVFRDGVITFHQTMTPHPANVRRRIRQLNDYMSPTADWISYAMIDDITDVYAPLVQQIEEEVDQIDDDILYLHQNSADVAMPRSQKAKSQADMGASRSEGDRTAGETGGDMLRRVGECRKKVMGLYRLLGNKADVIKGFAKRCNEHWEVAPRSEIGLYLGDIQDHIVTMTGNLSHYENLLSRAHSNYLAQINIRMNERAEMTADVLGKLTVLGTIVLPMNIITGMWGMNVWVPGQDAEEDLTWFWCITAGLVAFGLTSYFVAKKVYGIV